MSKNYLSFCETHCRVTVSLNGKLQSLPTEKMLIFIQCTERSYCRPVCSSQTLLAVWSVCLLMACQYQLNYPRQYRFSLIPATHFSYAVPVQPHPMQYRYSLFPATLLSHAVPVQQHPLLGRQGNQNHLQLLQKDKWLRHEPRKFIIMDYIL